MRRAYTRIEGDWRINEEEVSRLEYCGCSVFRYYPRCPSGWDKPSLERTSDGWRELLARFDSVDEAKTFYPKAVIG